jgi:hypothetical protein
MKKMKKEYMITMIIGLLLVFIGILLQLFSLAGGVLPLVLINAGTILIVIAVVSYNRYGAGISQDERTRQLGARALSYSWLLSFVVVNVLYWVDYTKIVALTVGQALGIMLFTMTLSAGIIQMFLKKRGTIDED